VTVLAIIEHDRGTISMHALGMLTAARSLAKQMGVSVEAVTIGANADGLADVLARHGADTVHQLHHTALVDYGPEAWGAATASLVQSINPQVVMGCGTDRGHEVIAQVAARLDLPASMNCTEFDTEFTGAQPLKVVRTRWGGSLMEAAEIDAPIKLVTLANHTVDASEAPTATSTNVVDVDLPDNALHSFVRERVERVAGVTLATAPVVVSGGRGVGSAEAFAPLEELASLLGGIVGCSRAVTNNGWRNHTDQVGQTGTRIAPDVYIACGISGAIQHWVGAMASKNIIAINTDKEANIVTKAGYAVIGDLHKVVPAISEEIRRRKGN
jgi:electron transfer flavoprotein alpha subunit